MPRSKLDSYNDTFTQYIYECFRRLEKRFDRCEQCDKPTSKLDIHHTKYEGATVYDLQLVCRRCNTQQANRFLV